MSALKRGWMATAALAFAMPFTVAFPHCAQAQSAPQTAPSTERQINGTLRSGDNTLESGEYEDSYYFRGQRGQQIRIRMESTAFDAYLLLRGPGVSQDNDDISDSNRNAEIRFTIPTNGEYRLVATSYQRGETGAYRLYVTGAQLLERTSGGGTSSGNAGGASGTAPAQRAQAAQPAQPLTPGTPVSGTLSEGDEQLRSGEYFDRYRLTAEPGARVTLRMESHAVDAYLLVVDDRNETIGENDDAPGGGGTNSRLEVTVPQSGAVTVLATSYRGGEEGAYTLTADAGKGEEQPSGPAAPSGTLIVGGQVDGALDTDDPERNGKRHDLIRFAGQAGQRVTFRLHSTEFDPVLTIIGPGGFIQANDDDPRAETLDSRLSVTLPVAGEYQLQVSSYATDATGAYTLSAEPTVTGGSAQQSPANAIALTRNRPVRGSLRNGDAQLDSGEWVDYYRFHGQRGERVRIDLESAAFDTWLILTSPDGTGESNDDAADPEGRPTNSRIDTVLSEEGDYIVGVTSYRPGETGSYTVTLKPGVEPERQATVPGGRRVYAVMVGVSDYGERINNLDLTDEDARKLGETLDQAGVLNPASITLVNSEATREGVRDAIRRVAAQAGPDDVFLFFYSGHGDQQPSENELDGTLETIELYDEAMTDAELVELFAPIHARLTLAVFDSCFSGGMRELINRPGIMGIFASEEDLTSQTAPKYEAGGYLSFFLRSGLSGAADANGDRIITAGELGQYIRQRFRDEGPIQSETDGGSVDFQNVLINRGSVRVDDVILRL